MIETILSASGVPYRQGRFLHPPAETYIVYFDDVAVDSADSVTPSSPAGLPRILRHDVTIELYEPKPDQEAETAIEAQLVSRGLPWTRQDRYWLQNVQRYQVIYEFSYNEKRRN